MGKAHGASVNDVVLWLCSAARRSYLTESRDLPGKSLVAGVPVSLRAEGDTRMNNQVTMSLVDLATQEGDPLERLRKIRAATASMKNTLGAFGELIPTDFPSLGAPWLLSGLAALAGRAKLAERLPAMINVLISNVPGPQFPLYSVGARLLGMYPIVPLIPGCGLGIALFSYDGGLFWGLDADRDAMPDLHDFVLALESEFATLCEL